MRFRADAMAGREISLERRESIRVSSWGVQEGPRGVGVLEKVLFVRLVGGTVMWRRRRGSMVVD